MSDRPYLAWVGSFADSLRVGAHVRPPSATVAVEPRDGAPSALIFAPHPDDEVIIGALPLRLLRERQWRIIDAAVTLGSDPSRQRARNTELHAACMHLGFDLHPMLLDAVTPTMPSRAPARWKAAVDQVRDLLAADPPRVVFLPHEADRHPTHVGVHRLVVAAMKRMPALDVLVVETEYWGAMEAPNLMVESAPGDVADLVAALSLHAGEVARNPYHLRLPAWMMDNVRRGAELVGGQGGHAPPFTFATLYRLRRWTKGGFREMLPRNAMLAAADDLSSLFPDTA